MIGCITLVHGQYGQVLAVDCSKGRGFILPGGKHEAGETFIECAKREFREETGLEAENYKLVFQAPDGFGFHVFAFEAVVLDFKSEEGEMLPVWKTWADLKKSKYKAYYELLEMNCTQ